MDKISDWPYVLNYKIFLVLSDLKYPQNVTLKWQKLPRDNQNLVFKDEKWTKNVKICQKSSKLEKKVQNWTKKVQNWTKKSKIGQNFKARLKICKN